MARTIQTKEDQGLLDCWLAGCGGWLTPWQARRKRVKRL